MADPKKTDTAAGAPNAGGAKNNQTANKDTKKDGAEELASIRSSRPNGHRRAGMRFTREARVIDVSALSDAQKEALLKDPFIKIGPAEAADTDKE